LARHEGEFRAESEIRFGLAELLEESAPALSDRERQDAIICYLTRSEGWEEALKLLGGAFASDQKVRHS